MQEDSLTSPDRKSTNCCRYLPVLGIVQICLLFMFLTFLWIHLNAGPPHWDDAWYLSDSMRLFDSLTQHGIVGWLITFHTSIQQNYKAPLICALPTPFFLILGRNIKAGFAVNVACVPVLVPFRMLIGTDIGDLIIYATRFATNPPERHAMAE